MPVMTDLQFDLGEDWLIDLTCLDSDGIALDVSGATAVIYVGPSSTPAAEITGTPGSNGKVSFVLPGADQTDVRPGKYPWTARITLAGGSITDQAAGTLTVRDV